MNNAVYVRGEARHVDTDWDDRHYCCILAATIFRPSETRLTSGPATSIFDCRHRRTALKADSEVVHGDLVSRTFPMLMAPYLLQECSDTFAANPQD